MKPRLELTIMIIIIIMFYKFCVVSLRGTLISISAVHAKVDIESLTFDYLEKSPLLLPYRIGLELDMVP